MNKNRVGGAVLWLAMAAAVAAATAAFAALYRLYDDPLPDLGAAFRTAAFVQPLPYAVAVGLAVWGRGRRAVQVSVLTAVVACGICGWWWLDGLREVRRAENEPVRRNSLGNMFPDAAGQAGAVEAFLWPALVAAIVGGSALVAWLATRPRPVRTDRARDR